ncbi:MAG: CBS domain-containing protein [Terriglobales bacterium]
MPLEQFRRDKLVILPARSTVYQAARAMADNHIGAVLVTRGGQLAGILTDRDIALAVVAEGRDAAATPLNDVMTEGVLTCPISSKIADAARLMREYGVRRLPLVEHGQPVGLLTFDDLVLSGESPLEALQGVLHEQLVEAEAPGKPAGRAYPARSVVAGRRLRSRMRAQARAQQVQDRLIGAMVEASGLDPDRAERGLTLGVCMLCHRLTPEEAQHTLAQLPSRMQSRLIPCADGPDRAVTSEAMRVEISRVLGLDSDAAYEFLAALFSVLTDFVSRGQMEEVKAQLPEDIRVLFPSVERAA